MSDQDKAYDDDIDNTYAHENKYGWTQGHEIQNKSQCSPCTHLSVIQLAATALTVDLVVMIAITTSIRPVTTDTTAILRNGRTRR